MADNAYKDPFIDSLVASPCSNPEMSLEEVLSSYSGLGYRNFEVFTGWAKSSFNISEPPDRYLEMGRRYGMHFTSFHLPQIGDDLEGTLQRAVEWARFAAALGVDVVLYKANSRENYIKAARPFLDQTEDLGLCPVLQNHAGTAISDLDDFREVIEGIDDSRMRTLLEVGHFHAVGVLWEQGYELLGESTALVHIKDQVGKQSVPFGTGEIDLPGLFRRLRSAGYKGRYVVEMEVQDKENTLQYLGEAIDYLKSHCAEDCNE